MTDFEKIFQQKYALTANNPAQREAVDTIDGPVLVIAGPGTGKTQLLSTRIANILRQTDATPDSILAMTFTDAGARNMRERLSTMIGAEAHKVNIFTYHGFSNSIIQGYREYFLDKNLENQADEITKIRIMQELIESLPVKSLLANASPRDILGVVGEMKKSAISPAQLKAITEANIAQQDAFHKEIEGLAPPRGARKFEAVEPFFLSVLEAMTRHNTFPQIKKGLISNIAYALEPLTVAFQEAQETGKAKPLNDWKKKFLSHKDQNDNFQLNDTVRNKKLLEFTELYAQYMEIFESEKMYDFDDMILEVIKALETHDDLRFTLQEKYQYILLDEYQDTNPAQARIVELLTDNPANNGRPNVLAVGDDDQAIMAFQGAGKTNMVDFNQRFKPEDIKVINLTKNYRSHGDILDSAKKVAETIGGRLTRQLPIKIEKNITAEGDFSKKESKILRADFASQVTEFSWVADEISKLLEKGTKPQEIAVLAPKHKLLEEVSKYLAQKNIPVWYEKRDNILEDPLVERIIKLSKLILAVREKDEIAMAELWPEVMSFDFWKIPATEAWKLSWHANDNREFWIEAVLNSECEQIRTLGELIVALAQASHEATFEEIFDAIIGTTVVSKEGQILDGETSNEENLETLRSPIRAQIEAQSPQAMLDTISTLTVLRDKLREFSAKEKNSLQDLVDFVNIHNQYEIKIINTNPHGTTENSVQLMTAFSSKGLEFEHVFLISLNNRTWNGKGNEQKTVQMPRNLRFTNITDDGEDTRKRLLFVAMTRAKTHLYLTNHLANFDGKPEVRLDFLDERESDGKMRTHILPEKYQKIQSLESETPTLKNAQINWHDFYQPTSPDMKNLLRDRLVNFRLSPTHLNSFVDIDYAGPQKFFENTILRFPQAYSSASMLGTLIHDGFNWIQDKINAGETPTFENLMLRIKEKISATPFSKSDKEKIAERAEPIFEKIFAEKFDDFKKGNIAEKNFAQVGITLGDARLTGKIDLIKIDRETKKITVVDYKTGKIPFTASGNISSSSSKIHKYEQQLYFYKILIENTPEFAGYEVVGGELEFVEPDAKTGTTATYKIDFSPEKEAHIKKLISTVWARIMACDFENPSEETMKNIKKIIDFENWLIEQNQA